MSTLEEVRDAAKALRLELRFQDQDQYQLCRGYDGAVQFSGSLRECAAFLVAWKPLEKLLYRLRHMPDDFRAAQKDLEESRQEASRLRTALAEARATCESLMLTATLERKKRIPPELLQRATAIVKFEPSSTATCVSCGSQETFDAEPLCAACAQDFALVAARAIVKAAS